MSNNWYSIFINGQDKSFLKLSRGVKQGDPLSPTLFIIAAENLSRGLNALHNHNEHKGYGIPKLSTKINHLAYIDHTNIFTSADSLQLIIKVLSDYEQASGQKVSKENFLHEKVASLWSQQVEEVTGFSFGTFPFTYLGCPITCGRRKKLIGKVNNKLSSWKGKPLSVGGKAMLIKQVL